MFSGGYFSSYAVDKLILAPRLTSAISIIVFQNFFIFAAVVVVNNNKSQFVSF